MTRDIIKTTNPWAFGIQSLELQNAETKAAATNNGSKRVQFSEPTQTRAALKHGQCGPQRLTTTNPEKKGTTLALSVLKFLLTKRYLRQGDGLLQTPASRLKERLFGEGGSGRAKLESAGMKLELVGAEWIDPHEDKCLAAFVREISIEATKD